MSVLTEFLIGSTLCLIQESIGMFLLRTCAFGTEGYFVHSQATDNFGGWAVAESGLGFDDKWEYSFPVCTAVKQDQTVAVQCHSL